MLKLVWWCFKLSTLLKGVSVIDAENTSVSKPQEIVEDRGSSMLWSIGVTKSQTQLSAWTTTNCLLIKYCIDLHIEIKQSFVAAKNPAHYGFFFLRFKSWASSSHLFESVTIWLFVSLPWRFMPSMFAKWHESQIATSHFYQLQ